jgi:hypothetical protein
VCVCVCVSTYYLRNILCVVILWVIRHTPRSRLLSLIINGNRSLEVCYDLVLIVTYHYGLLLSEIDCIDYCRWEQVFSGVARENYVVPLYDRHVASKDIYIYIYTYVII